MGYVSALQIYICFRRWRRDHRAHQSAGCVLEPEGIWNIELIG